jgi:hypothetical protein
MSDREKEQGMPRRLPIYRPMAVAISWTWDFEAMVVGSYVVDSRKKEEPI